MAWTNPDRITVAICTWRRPFLSQTLESLENQRTTPRSLDILVVDNDAERSAEDRVLAFSKTSRHPVTYAVAPEKNIAAVRNRCLDLATTEWIAFIDDDEVAAEDWLEELMKGAREEQAFAIFGSVLPHYDGTGKKWIRKGNPFSRDMPARGTRMQVGRSGNVLFHLGSVKRLGLRFDEKWGRLGGEDTAFFTAFAAGGLKMTSCPEAIVRETIPAQRLTLSYLRSRALRTGYAYALQTQGEARGFEAFPKICRYAAYSAAASAIFVLTRVVSHRIAVDAWQKIFLNAGKIQALLGFSSKQAM